MFKAIETQILWNVYFQDLNKATFLLVSIIELQGITREISFNAQTIANTGSCYRIGNGYPIISF